MRGDLAGDLRSQVLRSLPPGLGEKLSEVETVSGLLEFVVDPTLVGRAGGRARLEERRIALAPASTADLNAIGEEIMHWHRWTRGFPVVEPGPMAKHLGCKDGLQAVGGFFDEHAFFPFLESLGLDPRSALAPALEAAMDSITSSWNEIPRDGSQLGVLLTLSAAYVQAALMAPDSTPRDRLLKLFDNDALAVYRELGKILCAEIDLSAAEPADEVQSRMTRVVQEHWGLPPEVATVRRPFPLA